MMNKNILITGADGFIGSHLTEYLVNEGYKVRAFVYYNSFNSNGWLDSIPSEIKNKIEFFAGDIRDPNGVREAMKGTIPPKEQLLNVEGKDEALDTTKLEDSLGINNTDKFEKILGINKPEDTSKDKNSFLGLNKWILISSVLLISGAVAYKFYTKRK